MATTTATLALGEVLSTTTGAYLMRKYSIEARWARRARERLSEYSGKRASKAKVEAEREYGEARGMANAYRDALIAMVIDASMYTVTRFDASRAIAFEAKQINNPPVVRFDDGDAILNVGKLDYIFK